MALAASHDPGELPGSDSDLEFSKLWLNRFTGTGSADSDRPGVEAHACCVQLPMSPCEIADITAVDETYICL